MALQRSAVRDAAQAAMTATLAFRDWVHAQAPSKTGPSGVGIANYDWYMRYVQLVPYSWAEQGVLLKRELARAYAGMAEEEVRNRKLPALRADWTAKSYLAFDDARMAKYINFVVDCGFAPNEDIYRAALKGQEIGYVAPKDRNFFTNITTLDPLPLYSHDIHWVELAKIRYEPNPDPVRRGAPLYNIYAARSEGFATGFEELVMRAGLYDDEPRGRELVWIMLAKRAARGLASLYVQANQMDLATAGKFHASHTPRGYSDPNTALVGFEQMLYLRQPGYGTSYITGKLLLDRMMAENARQRDDGSPQSNVSATLSAIYGVGIVPWPLVEDALGLRPLTP